MFIVLEGLDGSGKTTQAKLLHNALVQRGLNALLVREPGSTPIGEQIRAVLHDGRNVGMTAKCEALLYAAARAQLVETQIKPALKAGRVVICDRYIPSSIAYQVYGREPHDLSEMDVYHMNDLATGHIMPDAVIYLDVPVDAALERRIGAGNTNRMDKQPKAFYGRVANGYKCASQDEWGFADVWHTISGVGSIEEIHGRVMSVADGLMIAPSFSEPEGSKDNG